MQTRPHPLLALAALLAALLGPACVTSTWAPEGQAWPARPEGHPVEVYRGAQASGPVGAQVVAGLPPGAVPVGSVRVLGALASGASATLGRLRARARGLGGDGVVVYRWRSYSLARGLVTSARVYRYR